MFEPNLDFSYVDTKVGRLKSDTELHPSIVTLAKDPFRNIPLQEHNKTRVICAKLDRDNSAYDREQRLKEDDKLKSEAFEKLTKAKAYEIHSKRVYEKF